MRVSLEGKVALVTGGSRGIGAATVRLLRESGARVVFSYRSAAAQAGALAEACGGEAVCRALQQELATVGDGEALVRAAANVWGRLDILVANHGVWPPHDQPIATMGEAQWRSTMGINLDSVFGLVRAAAAQMLGTQAATMPAGSEVGGEEIAAADATAYAGAQRYGLGEAETEARAEAGVDARALLEEAVFSDRIVWPTPVSAAGGKQEADAAERGAEDRGPIDVYASAKASTEKVDDANFQGAAGAAVRGHIVLVASTAAQRGEAFHADYAASKGALVSLTKSLSSELGPQGILCNCVAPGWVRTEMAAGTLSDPVASKKALSLIPLGRAAEPEEIAGPIVFLCSPWAGFVSGEIWNINGGAVLVG